MCELIVTDSTILAVTCELGRFTSAVFPSL